MLIGSVTKTWIHTLYCMFFKKSCVFSVQFLQVVMKEEVSVSSLVMDNADSNSQSVKTSNDSPSVGRQTRCVAERAQTEVVTNDVLNEFREVGTTRYTYRLQMLR